MQRNPTPQTAPATENSTLQGIICLACLTLFPLIYFIGKTIVSLI